MNFKKKTNYGLVQSNRKFVSQHGDICEDCLVNLESSERNLAIKCYSVFN